MMSPCLAGCFRVPIVMSSRQHRSLLPPIAQPAINLDTPSDGLVFEVSLKQLEIRTRYDISEELFKLTSRPFYAIFASKPFYIEQKTAITVFT